MPEAVNPPEVEQFEQGLIEVFSDLADLFGNPRSHGMIYGLLFASTSPLTMEEICRRLEISTGSASMGLRVLEGFGAVHKTDPKEARGQSVYQARMELRPLIKGFIKNRLVPKLEASNQKLAEVASLVPQRNDKEFAELRARVGRVQNWHKRAAQVLAGADQILRLVSK